MVWSPLQLLNFGEGNVEKTVKLFDFDTPENNDFLVTNQFQLDGLKQPIYPDIVVFVNVIPVNFSMEHKSMLGNVKMLIERDGGYVAINPKFDKLITSLRTAVEKGEGALDKEVTSYNDVFAKS